MPMPMQKGRWHNFPLFAWWRDSTKSRPPATLAHQLGFAPSEQLTHTDLLRAAKHLQLKARLSCTRVERLELAPLPALALVRTADGGSRAVILARCDGKRVLLQDPSLAAGERRVIEYLLSPIQKARSESLRER
jgi:ABC-type bacteriocin/lantibiotic exporter with double-glycine peptidase domain